MSATTKQRFEELLDELRDTILSQNWPAGRPSLSVQERENLGLACEDGDIRVTANEMTYWSPNHNLLIVAPSTELAEALNEQDWTPFDGR